MSAPATTNPMLFDGCGNRTSLNGVVQTFDNLNRLTTTAGTIYNSNSALTAWYGWTCTYDAQNRLTGAIKGASTLSFSYDAKNRQIARSINGAITFSVWDDWELVEEYTTGNVRTATYLQGAHGPIKSLLNNIYFYQDSLGSTSHIANSSGALLEYYKYDLNGKPTYWSPLNTQLSTSNYGVRDLFTGERFISEMGMYDLRNRYYSPELGRFLQPDPIGFKGDGSNLYRYCGNDWANRTDPMGLQAGHQSSDKCTNAFNLPDWLYKDMRGLNSSQPAGITMAPISAETEGPKGSQSVHDMTINQLRKQLVATKDQATTMVPTKEGPQITDAATETKAPRSARDPLGDFGYRGAQEQLTVRSDALRIIHAHTHDGIEAAMPSKDRDYGVVQQTGKPMYFTSKYLARHGADPGGTAGNYIILHFNGPRYFDKPRFEYRFDPRLTLPSSP